jgi:flavin reductase (DIM6/NTAB) family NADH-FMN oxidoreductase RutF
MDRTAMREALARLVSGVYVLTVSDGADRNGMPVSWVTQVSAEPPLIAVAVSPSRYTHDMVDGAGEFALNLLAADQGEFVRRFAVSGPDKEKKFEGVAVEKGRVVAAPLLSETPVSYECRVHTAYTPGDHTLFVAEVVAVTTRFAARPLDAETFGPGYRGGA